MKDLHGLDLGTASAAAADAFNRALRSYLGYRTDVTQHAKGVFEARA